MIWLWINNFVRWLGWLLIPPEAKILIPEIDENEACPVCGHRNGGLSVDVNGGKPAVRHTCKTCGARWFVDPIMKAPDKIQAEPPTPKE